MKSKILYIDALAFKIGKAFGFNEYLFNLLDNFYINRNWLEFKKIILVVEDSQKTAFLKYADKFIIRTFKFSNLWSRMCVQSFWNLRVRIYRDDVVLAVANYSTVFKRGKLVLVIHDLLFKHKEICRLGIMGVQRRLFVPLSLRHADKVICISNFTASEVKQYYKFAERKILTIYNSFNFLKFGNTDKVSTRTGILSVCSNAMHKNTITVLKAFARYCELGGTQDLNLIGRFYEDDTLSPYFNGLHSNVRCRIHIFSDLDNVQLGKHYAADKIYVSASKYEGLGMPIVEAMYFRMHILLPKEPAIFSEITQGKSGHFNSSDANELAEKLLDLDKVSPVECPDYDLALFSEQNTSGAYIKTLNGF